MHWRQTNRNKPEHEKLTQLYNSLLSSAESLFKSTFVRILRYLACNRAEKCSGLWEKESSRKVLRQCCSIHPSMQRQATSCLPTDAASPLHSLQFMVRCQRQELSLSFSENIKAIFPARRQSSKSVR